MLIHSSSRRLGVSRNVPQPLMLLKPNYNKYLLLILCQTAITCVFHVFCGYGGGKSSFQQYERDTEDAWDDGDDDLLMRLKLDTNFIQSTASQIIDSHSNSSPVKPHIQNSSRGRPFLC